MVSVCDAIIGALEGAKQWTKYYYDNVIEREAYVAAFERCQLLVKENDLRPDVMLKALSDFHSEVTRWRIMPPFFSLARWVYKPNEARADAVIAAFTLVDSISKRFL